MFATTKNVRVFHAGMEAIRGDGKRKAWMGLVHGAWGTGKTVTAQQYAAENGVTYVAAVKEMTRRSLLAAVVGELGHKPAWAADACFHQAADLLCEPGRMLVVDEVDFLVESGLVEVLRNLYDHTACPVVMIGMKAELPSVLKSRWPWLFDRTGTLVHFSAFNAEELADLAEQICEVRLDPSAIQLIVSRGQGRLRPSFRAFEVAERVAKTNRLDVVGAEHLRAALPDESGGATRRRGS